MHFPILSTILMAPVVGLFLVLMTPSRYETLIKLISLTASAVTLGLSIYLCRIFNAADPSFQFIEHIEWVKSYGG